MRRRIEVKETVIAPGAIVRLKKEVARRQADLLARWVVLEIDPITESVAVRDTQDWEDVRSFDFDDLERVSGGVEKVTGVEYVNEPDFQQGRGGEDDDPYDDGEVESFDTAPPSLFDDPVALQMAEDEEDEDYEGVAS